MSGGKKQNGLLRWVWIISISVGGMTAISILGGGVWAAVSWVNDVQTKTIAKTEHDEIREEFLGAQKETHDKLDEILGEVKR